MVWPLPQPRPGVSPGARLQSVPAPSRRQPHWAGVSRALPFLHVVENPHQGDNSQRSVVPAAGGDPGPESRKQLRPSARLHHAPRIRAGFAVPSPTIGLSPHPHCISEASAPELGDEVAPLLLTGLPRPAAHGQSPGCTQWASENPQSGRSGDTTVTHSPAQATWGWTTM